MKKNDEFILDIIDLTTEGSGIGKIDGMAVFVPLTAIGDRAKVKILKVKKSYAYGKLLSLEKPSKSRIDNDCPCFNQCGGCVFRHISYDSECEHKQNKVYENIKRIGGVDLAPHTIIADSPDRYRNKAQYPISTDYNAGFYAFHSHRIIPCDDCRLQPKIFSQITTAVTEWAKEKDISIYNEAENKGFLRHIYIRKAAKTSEIMVCLVINGDFLPESDALVEKLQSICGDDLKSLQINVNKKDTNVILGDTCKTIYGSDYITDILCGVKIRLSPLSFYQVNHTMAEKLYEKAREYACPKGKNIMDLYCGAGTIGLSMAKDAKSIIGVEIIPEAIEDAKHNAKINGIENARFICADATAAAKQLEKEGVTCDVVIVDPPRKGCSAEVINTITQSFKPKDVVYVSCDSATLSRDIKLFGENGYALKEYTPCDLFPRTSHVETVALLVRTVSSI
jgi:23S rRNA (uracil1939-C5)-methyltransferase